MRCRATDLRQPSPALRAPRKLHAQDPLFWRLFRAWAAADPDPWSAIVASLVRPDEIGRLVESVIVVQLMRAFGEHVFCRRPDNRREIGFVVAHPPAGVFLGEGKYRSGIDEGDVRTLERAGGGILATCDTEGDLAGSLIYALPSAELLALLDAPALAVARAG